MADFAQLNGFRKLSEMIKAHDRLSRDLACLVPTEPKSILDAGCGDGALLECLGKQFPVASLFGIESETLQWKLACARAHAFPGRWRIAHGCLCHDYSWPRASADVLLLNPRRFADCPTHRREEMLLRCQRARWVCFYGYGYDLARMCEWVASFGLHAEPMPASTAQSSILLAAGNTICFDDTAATDTVGSRRMTW